MNEPSKMRYSLLILTATNIVATIFASTLPGSPLPPSWPKQYKVIGTIRLPYVPITEPFEAYVDMVNQRSRVDYYGGITKTVQTTGN